MFPEQRREIIGQPKAPSEAGGLCASSSAVSDRKSVGREVAGKVECGVCGRTFSATGAARSLIDKVIVYPPTTEGEPPTIELVGELKALLDAAAPAPVAAPSSSRDNPVLDMFVSAVKAGLGGSARSRFQGRAPGLPFFLPARTFAYPTRPAIPRAMPDIFDEVSEDLRADQARNLLRRFGGVLIAAMVATLLGVGAYEWWQNQQQAASDAVAVKFIAAQKASQAHTPPKDLARQFADIAAPGSPEGYRLLAQLQLAALDWDAGRHDKAVVEWQAVSADTTAPQLLRDLATLTRVQRQVDTGDAKSLKLDLLPILQGGGPFRPLAVEVDALLDLRLGRTKEAKALMRSLVDDPATPQTLRQLTQSLLSATGADVPDAAK